MILDVSGSTTTFNDGCSEAKARWSVMGACGAKFVHPEMRSLRGKGVIMGACSGRATAKKLCSLLTHLATALCKLRVHGA